MTMIDEFLKWVPGVTVAGIWDYDEKNVLVSATKDLNNAEPSGSFYKMDKQYGAVFEFNPLSDFEKFKTAMKKVIYINDQI